MDFIDYGMENIDHENGKTLLCPACEQNCIIKSSLAYISWELDKYYGKDSTTEMWTKVNDPWVFFPTPQFH